MQTRAPLFELISGKAGWLAQRQAVLTRNVAHADTPGFVPLDLEPADPAELARGTFGRMLPLVRTAAVHLPGSDADGVSQAAVEEAPSFETKPAGNSVDLAEQMRKMSATDLDYQLTTSLYRRYVGMLRTALGVPQGG